MIERSRTLANLVISGAKIMKPLRTKRYPFQAGKFNLPFSFCSSSSSSSTQPLPFPLAPFVLMEMQFMRPGVFGLASRMNDSSRVAGERVFQSIVIAVLSRAKHNGAD